MRKCRGLNRGSSSAVVRLLFTRKDAWVVARAEIIWLAAAVALGASPTASDCTESIGARGGLSTGPELSEVSASGTGWRWEGKLCLSCGLEEIGLLKSKSGGPSRGETVGGVKPICICLDAATTPWMGDEGGTGKVSSGAKTLLGASISGVMTDGSTGHRPVFLQASRMLDSVMASPTTIPSIVNNSALSTALCVVP